MKKSILFLSLFVPGLAQAALLKCDYAFSGSPAGTVSFELSDDGIPGATASVALFFTPPREMPVSVEPAQAGEYLRLALAKGDINNEIHVILYPGTSPSFKSKLINPSAPPLFKEIPGSCQ